MTMSKQTGKTHGGYGLAAGILMPEPERLPENVRPFVEIGMKVQSEFLTLCGHRVRAWFDWPEKLCACKTAADLTTAQGDYLATMQHNYAVYLDGVLRDAMVEQDELEEDGEDGSSGHETETPHREAA